MPNVTRYATPADYVASIPTRHLKGCTLGPMRCAICTRQLAETAEEHCARVAAENQYRHLRAAANAPVVRKTEAEWREHFAQKLGYGTLVPERSSGYVVESPLTPHPSMDPDYQPFGQPPDGYAIALKLKKENR